MQQLDPIYVDVTQSSSELLRLRRELAAGNLERNGPTPVTILLEDGSEFSHKGTLEFSEVSVDPSTGSFNLRIRVDNPDHILMPGMYVRAVLDAGMRQDAILAPMQGIARDPKGNTTAMVVNADGVVEQRPVVVSQTIGDQWLVESGLAAGDRVVVEGLQKIAPGARVEVVEKAAAPRPLATPAPAPRRGTGRDPRGKPPAVVVNAVGGVWQRPGVVSQTIGDQWRVECGLAAGDRVVVEGLQKIAPGARVEVVEKAAAPRPLATPAPATDAVAHDDDAAKTAATASTTTTPAPAAQE